MPVAVTIEDITSLASLLFILPFFAYLLYTSRKADKRLFNDEERQKENEAHAARYEDRTAAIREVAEALRQRP